MALPSSGQLSIGDLQQEFSSQAGNLSAYYRGAGVVPDTSVNAAVPESGAIALSDFYGASASVATLVATPSFITIVRAGLSASASLLYTGADGTEVRGSMSIGTGGGGGVFASVSGDGFVLTSPASQVAPAAYRVERSGISVTVRVRILNT